MSLITKVVLNTNRLLLSPFSEADGPAVYNYARNPIIAETVTWDAHQSVADSLSFIKFVSSKTSFEDGAVFIAWAIRDRMTKGAIGSISFSQYSKIGGQIDYALGVDYWNQGLMTEAAMKVVSSVFESLPELVRIQAKCLVHNQGSRKVMEKIGMKYEGITRAGMLVKGLSLIHI